MDMAIVTCTPQERFQALPDFLYAPRFIEVNGACLRIVEL